MVAVGVGSSVLAPGATGPVAAPASSVTPATDGAEGAEVSTVVAGGLVAPAGPRLPATSVTCAV